jgi:nucleotide-binding universal stress UspA family protein
VRRALCRRVAGALHIFRPQTPARSSEQVPPLALCAVADDDQIHGVVAAGRRLQAADAFTPRYVHVAPFGSWTDPNPPFIAALGLPEDAVEITAGSTAATLERRAEQLGAALVIAGNRRRGMLASALTGSVSRALLRHGTRPVLMAGDEPDSGGDRAPVVCGITAPGPEAERIARAAAGLARRMERPLVLASVVGDEHDHRLAGAPGMSAHHAVEHERRDASALLERTATWLQAPDGVETVVLTGPPAERLAELGDRTHAALLVVGSRGAGVLGTLLGGSVSRALLRRSRRPVVVVPPGWGRGAGGPGAH